MRMYDIIKKKRDGHELSREEIGFFIRGYTRGEIPDYQASALMMAIYFRKMNHEETLSLTMEMANSGDVLDLSEIGGVKVDKHSTGGVGDKVTLVVAPLVAAAGVPVAKMSGRGLGHTGGTIDKLESFEGFDVNMSPRRFIESVNKIGIAIGAQTGNLAPADKKLYALRDVTATVDDISLIASSIMSKKLASGADAMVLDVKCGSGAFMKDEEGAFSLAREMVGIGTGAGREVVAVVSDMDQPLGRAVGNSLEVVEAINTLKGEGPGDIEELSLYIGAHMLILSGKADSMEEGMDMLKEMIASGRAIGKLKELVANQGGDASLVDDVGRFKKARIIGKVESQAGGYVTSIMSEEIGRACLVLGAGREDKESEIDLCVGLEIEKKKGDFVEKGETLAIIHANDQPEFEQAADIIRRAYSMGKEPVERDMLIKGMVDKNGTRYF